LLTDLSTPGNLPVPVPADKTHFCITLRRSGISLGNRVQGTLTAPGLRRPTQTLYHLHTPEAAGTILTVKELDGGHMMAVASDSNGGPRNNAMATLAPAASNLTAADAVAALVAVMQW